MKIQVYTIHNKKIHEGGGVTKRETVHGDLGILELSRVPTKGEYIRLPLKPEDIDNFSYYSIYLVSQVMHTPGEEVDAQILAHVKRTSAGTHAMIGETPFEPKKFLKELGHLCTWYDFME